MKRPRKSEHMTGLEFSDPATPQHINDYVDYTVDVANYIAAFVNSPNFKQKDIADKLNKHESEISKWLNGFHNLTLKSIIKLESVCSIKLLNPAIFNHTQTMINEGFVSSVSVSSSDVISTIGNMYPQVPERALSQTAVSGYTNTGISANTTISQHG